MKAWQFGVQLDALKQLAQRFDNYNTWALQPGSCWYLDTRKPHTAVNDGATDRVHLVVDVESNDAIRKLITT